jgi:hypothetical protein
MPVATRGTEYLALCNLSISRPGTRDGKGERQADIVHRGELVTLTDEQAQGFLTRHAVPVIRKASEGTDPGAPITARKLFGRRPGAAQFGAREDPPGSSKVTVNEDIPDPIDPRNAPEATDPTVDLSVDPDAAKDR